MNRILISDQAAVWSRRVVEEIRRRYL